MQTSIMQILKQELNAITTVGLYKSLKIAIEPLQYNYNNLESKTELFQNERKN